MVKVKDINELTITLQYVITRLLFVKKYTYKPLQVMVLC